MKVLYDVTSLLNPHITGVGMYTRNLYRGLRGLGVDVNPVYVGKGKFQTIEAHLKATPKVFRSMFMPKNSVIHGTDVNMLSDSPKFKKVITVHDMAMFRDGMMDARMATKLQDHLKTQLDYNPDAVIVPSYEVHAEFLVRFPKYMNKVHVVYHGSDHLIDTEASRSKTFTDKPYFLYVGTIEKRKNISALVEAFEMFCGIDKETHLILIGDDGYGAEAIHKYINTLSCKSRIIRSGYVPNAQLKRLYSGAVGFVFPSLYEGSSIALLEAMKMGCPAVTSSVGSTAEFGRDSAHLVNPLKADQIFGGMERLAFDRSYRAKLIDQGKARTEKMTWLNCARETAAIYNRVYGK